MPETTKKNWNAISSSGQRWNLLRNNMSNGCTTDVQSEYEYKYWVQDDICYISHNYKKINDNNNKL